jgi:quinoprotein glucose dehydrogenase
MTKAFASTALGLSLFSVAASGAGPAAPAPQLDWPVYGGQGAQDHYSTLSQINRTNVKDLVVAWKYDTAEQGGDLEATPIVVGNVLYTLTPSHGVIALDAASGKLLWKFEADVPGFARSRGVSYWTDGHESRIFAAVRNELFALDASTGKIIPGFGENGHLDLRKGLREPYQAQSVQLTTPGIVYKDLIIVGGQNPETHPAPPGDIRAFDVRTGALRWTFHTIPHPGEFGYDTWPKATASTVPALLPPILPCAGSRVSSPTRRSPPPSVRERDGCLLSTVSVTRRLSRWCTT